MLPDKTVGDAAKDFKYLLDRGYKRRSSLNFIGERYQLTKEEKNFLFRYVFSDKEIKDHMSRLIPLDKIKGKDVVVDAYNVLITAEAVLKKENLVDCMDGFLRDSSGIFSNYRFGEKGKIALERILELFMKYHPRSVLFVFDSQISRSGELAEYTRKRLVDIGMNGNAKVSRSTDNEIININRITATTDTIIIENINRVIDVGRGLLEFS